jgi:hypothetical protein
LLPNKNKTIFSFQSFGDLSIVDSVVINMGSLSGTIIKSPSQVRRQWLTPVILATQEAEKGGSRLEASLGK